MTQAQRIIHAFGGPTKLMRALGDIGVPVNKSTIYRWTYPRERGGCGGRIPTYRFNDIRRAGRYAGVLISEQTLYGGEF